MVLLKMLHVEDTLGDEAVDVPGEPGNDRKQGHSRADTAAMPEVAQAKS